MTILPKRKKIIAIVGSSGFLGSNLLKYLKFDYDISDIEEVDNDGGYEGAIVLKPTPGIYLDTPVSVMDYASLYPSSMISENLSHDSIILNEKYMGDDGIKELDKLGYGYVEEISTYIERVNNNNFTSSYYIDYDEVKRTISGLVGHFDFTIFEHIDDNYILSWFNIKGIGFLTSSKNETTKNNKKIITRKRGDGKVDFITFTISF